MTTYAANVKLRLGFACSWWHPAEPTWSYTPAGLLRALSDRDDVDVARLDAQLPLPGKAVVKLAHSFSDNAWQLGRANRLYQQRKIAHDAARTRSDAVLAMSVTEPALSLPTFFYQDMGFSVAAAYMHLPRHHASNLGPATAARLSRLSEQEADRYRRCAGILTMSQWFADWLVDRVGVPRDKVHVVGGGINATSAPSSRTTRGSRHDRLLFVGRDFFRKGGDAVVEAVANLRASGSGDYRLTVVGPATWPMQGEPPPWVDFQGSLRPAEVGQLWNRHDVFVLPSRFEAYGLTFLEARAAGLPCIGRRAFAMPELVPDGAGALIDEQGGAEELAAAIHAVSTDDSLHERVGEQAPRVARDNSWAAVADRVLAVVKPQALDAGPGAAPGARSTAEAAPRLDPSWPRRG